MYFKQRQPVLIESGHPVYTCVYKLIDYQAQYLVGENQSLLELTALKMINNSVLIVCNEVNSSLETFKIGISNYTSAHFLQLMVKFFCLKENP